MRITHVVIFENYQEGYSYQENLLSQKHKEQGYDVSIIASQCYRDNNWVYHKRPEGKYVNEYGINVTVLKDTNLHPFIGQYLKKCHGLYQSLCENTPDIIFLHNFTHLDVIDVVKYMRKHHQTKLFVDCHSDYFNNPVDTRMRKIQAKKIAFYGHLLLRYTRRFWGTTPWREQYLREIYKIPADKTGTLIMGADESKILGRNRKLIREEIRSRWNIPQDAFLVTTGGKIDKRKQQNLLMEAVVGLKSNNVWLIVFGSFTPDMQKYQDKYSKSPNIVLTGWLPSDEAYDLFFASDIAFFPGTHSVLWEQAAACGIPVVVKHWKGMEHIDAGGNAILMDEVNVNSISNVIISMTNKDYYDNISKSAQKNASSFFLNEIAKLSINEK